MTIKALCFDFDGTLARFVGDFDALNRSVWAKLDLPAHLFQTSIERFVHHDRKEGASSLAEILKRVVGDLGYPAISVEAAAKTTMDEYLKGMTVLPGVQEVLELTRHLPCALITNGPSDLQRAAVKRVGLENHFQTIVVSGDADVAVRKPKARIFEIACQRLGGAPGDTLMIGDNLDADVRGALAYGMQAVWLGEGAAPNIDQVANVTSLYSYLEPKLAR